MKRLLAIPVILLIGFLLVVYLVLPNYVKYKRVNQEVIDGQTELTRIQNVSVQMVQTSEKLLKNQEALNKIKAGLPQEFFLASLLDFLQKKASNSGLILESISEEANIQDPRRPKDEQEQTRIKEYRLNIAISGFLSSLEGFLDSLEKSSRMIEVLSISSGDETKDGAEGSLDFSILLKVQSY